MKIIFKVLLFPVVAVVFLFICFFEFFLMIFEKIHDMVSDAADDAVDEILDWMEKKLYPDYDICICAEPPIEQQSVSFQSRH